MVVSCLMEGKSEEDVTMSTQDLTSLDEFCGYYLVDVQVVCWHYLEEIESYKRGSVSEMNGERENILCAWNEYVGIIYLKIM